jgi:large subunit ribosomal protein L3
MIGILGKKLGMTQIFTEDGQPVPVTIIEALPSTIMALKTMEVDGYKAIKVAAGSPRKEKHLTQADIGQFKKAGVSPTTWIAEFRLEDLADWEVGKQYNVSILEGEKRVTVVGISKGRGFAGTIKRHKFSRGPSTHGSKNVRAPGSMGAHSYPARVFPGKKLGGHMGVDQKTVKNLELVKIDVENNLLFIKGAVPGASNGKIIIRKQHG